MGTTKKQTAMQDLKQDLQESIIKAKKELESIDNIGIREASKKLLEITLNAVIKRIDDELLQMEKEQDIYFAKHCLDKAKDLDILTSYKNVEQYYTETYETN